MRVYSYLAVSLLSAVPSLSVDVKTAEIFGPELWPSGMMPMCRLFFFSPTVVRKYLTKQLKEGFMLIQLGYSPLWMGRLGSMGTRRYLQSQSRR